MARFLYIRNVIMVTFIISGLLLPTIVPLPVIAQTQVQDEQAKRAELERQLAALEKELEQVTAQLQTQKGQSASITRDISILTSKINQSKLDIRSKNVLIEKLGGEINDKNQTIYSLTEKIEREKESMAQLLKKSYELQDETSFVHVVMAGQTLSDFYRDLDDFYSIQGSIHESLSAVRTNKVVVETEKTDLVKKQDEQENARAKLEEAKRAVELNEKEKQKLLKASKGKESEYEKVKAEKEKQKNQILAALFSLRDSNIKINFEQALAYANAAGAATGVRPAFILAILKQETNLGQNVGTCVITDLDSGQTKHVNTGKIYANGIHPTRDLPKLQTILSELGRNPLETRVSCPLAGGGYGGAMGPAQFIPSTWSGMKTKIAAAINKTVPDPWNPRDAFFASAVFLRDLGASAQTYTAERNAACRYYSGRACDSKKPANAFYGDSVMSLASSLQKDIDLVEGN